MAYIIFSCIFFITLLSLQKYRKIRSIVFFLLLFVFAALRGNCSNDSSAYASLFIRANSLNLLPFIVEEKIEPMFWLLSRISAFFHMGYQGLVAIYSFFSLLIWMQTISKKTDASLLSQVIFYCFFYYFLVFNQIRYGIAIGLFWLFYKEENPTIINIIIIILCSLFHYSMIVLIFPAIVKNNKWFVSISLIALPLLLLASNLYSEMFSRYFNLETEKVIIPLIVFFEILIITILFYYRIYTKTMEYRAMELGILFSLVFIKYQIVSTRINDIGLLSIVFLLPAFISRVQEKKICRIIIIIICLLRLSQLLFINPIVRSYCIF